MGTYFHRRSWVTWRWTGPLVKGARRVWADKSSKLKDLTRNVTAAFNWSNSRRVCSAPEHGYCHLQVVIRWNVDERNEKCTLKAFMKTLSKVFKLDLSWRSATNRPRTRDDYRNRFGVNLRPKPFPRFAGCLKPLVVEISARESIKESMSSNDGIPPN